MMVKPEDDFDILTIDVRGASLVVVMYDEGPGDTMRVRAMSSLPKPVAAGMLRELATRWEAESN